MTASEQSKVEKKSFIIGDLAFSEVLLFNSAGCKVLGARNAAERWWLQYHRHEEHASLESEISFHRGQRGLCCHVPQVYFVPFCRRRCLRGAFLEADTRYGAESLNLVSFTSFENRCTSWRCLSSASPGAEMSWFYPTKTKASTRPSFPRVQISSTTVSLWPPNAPSLPQHRGVTPHPYGGAYSKSNPNTLPRQLWK